MSKVLGPQDCRSISSDEEYMTNTILYAWFDTHSYYCCGETHVIDKSFKDERTDGQKNERTDESLNCFVTL